MYLFYFIIYHRERAVKISILKLFSKRSIRTMKAKSCLVNGALTTTSKFKFKYEVGPIIEILYSSEVQPRHLYNVFINGVDRVHVP